jgi:hypothetical protein
LKNKLIEIENEKEQIKKEIHNLKTKPKSSRIDIQEHNGIILNLRQNDPNSVQVEASDTYPGHPIQNILKFDNSPWWNTNQRFDSSITFQFLSKKIKPSKYLLRTANCSTYPQGWKLEGSNDKQNWELIDQKNNQTYFNYPFQSYFFDCQSNSFYSFLKLAQTQKSSSNNNLFILSFVEFGGNIIDL